MFFRYAVTFEVYSSVELWDNLVFNLNSLQGIGGTRGRVGGLNPPPDRWLAPPHEKTKYHVIFFLINLLINFNVGDTIFLF